MTNSTQSVTHAMASPSTTNSSAAADPAILAKLPFIVGGGVLLCIVLSVVLAVFLWKKRPPSATPEDPGFHDVKKTRSKVYNEMIEVQGLKYVGKKRGPHDDVIAVDSAPDIITSHDGESIYETIDGKRSLRNKAAGQAHTSPENIVSPAAADSPLNRTYDHLEHFRVDKSRGFNDHHLHASPRIDTARRAQASYLPDSVNAGLPPAGKRKELKRGANKEGNRGTAIVQGRREASPQTRRSSLADSTGSQSSSSGRRIVCQLTMVGVVENGRPVPIQKKATSNAYFVYEPKDDGDSLSDGVASFPMIASSKFRVREDRAASSDVPETASDYFILEPLEVDEDIEDMFGVHDDSQTVTAQDKDLSPEPASRFSLHGQNTISCFRGFFEGHKRRQQFRDGRIKSCPEDTAPEAGKPPAPSAPPTQPPEYKRSVSSPNPKQHDVGNDAACNVRDRKLDPAFLHARIQQELEAMGLVQDGNSTPSSHQVNAKNQSTLGPVRSQSAEPGSGSNARPAPQSSEYFILEPGAASEDSSDEDASSLVPVVPTFTAPHHGKNSSRPLLEHYDPQGGNRYQRQQSHGMKPRLPRRNQMETTYHTRSKSETPLVATNDVEEGPVIVSLKKSKSHEEKVLPDKSAAAREKSDNDDYETPQRRGSFRPRLKSAPSKTSINES